MGGINQNPNEELDLVPHLSELYTISGDVARGEYQINAQTNSVRLNEQELVKSYWQTLSGEARVGFIGLFLTLIGGAWTIGTKLTKRILLIKGAKKHPVIPPPPIGCFVCVMQSGIIVAGELACEPGFFFPFYLLHNARRKMHSSDQWDDEIIKEIRIRASHVEQSYFLREISSPNRKEIV
jgi:hypothetical protein